MSHEHHHGNKFFDRGYRGEAAPINTSYTDLQTVEAGRQQAIKDQAAAAGGIDLPHGIVFVLLAAGFSYGAVQLLTPRPTNTQLVESPPISTPINFNALAEINKKFDIDCEKGMFDYCLSADGAARALNIYAFRSPFPWFLVGLGEPAWYAEVDQSNAREFGPAWATFKIEFAKARDAVWAAKSPRERDEAILKAQALVSAFIVQHVAPAFRKHFPTAAATADPKFVATGYIGPGAWGMTFQRWFGSSRLGGFPLYDATAARKTAEAIAAAKRAAPAR